MTSIKKKINFVNTMSHQVYWW